MTIHFNSGNVSTLHPVLAGLDERQIAAVYQAFEVTVLQAGECLFSEGDEDDSTYLVLSGSLRIQHIRKDVIFPLTQIDRDGQITPDMFLEKGRRNGSAIAREPTKVIVMNGAAMMAMEPGIQIALYRSMQRHLSGEISQLYSQHKDALFKNAHLGQELNVLLLGKSDKYASSSAIQGMLKRVPKLPPYASQLTGLLLTDDVSAKDVTELAKLDPSLTGAVLKTVNSAYYGLNQKIKDFQHAALLLGFNQIYQLIINLGIQKTMPDTGQFKRLQAHCVFISILSFEISQVTGCARGPIMNTIGLLHDIGKSVLLLLISQNPKLAFFISLLDHAHISALLLENWEIPEDIYGPLEYQNYPEFLPPDMIPEQFRKQVSILYLAHLCQDCLTGRSDKGISAVFLDDYLQELGIREGGVAPFIEKRLVPAMKKRLPTYPVEVQEAFSSFVNEDNYKAL